MSIDYPPHNLLHKPVMLDKVIELLSPRKGDSYLDLTAGLGGHASQILNISGNYEASILVDRDEYAIEHLKSLSDLGAKLLRTDFCSAAKELQSSDHKFDMILVDLGVSSPQLDQAERGFSFTKGGPLDMRMDRRQKNDAEVLVNNLSLDELADIIHRYGEEPYGLSRNIAKAIIKHRPIKNTEQLASLIEDIYHSRRGRIHPATRTFQALRIAVNDEINQIETLLPILPDLLSTGGRLAIISFHSLEDRLVKRFMMEQRDSGLEAELTILTKKPLLGNVYDVSNPRARSAKLRAAVKK